MKTIENVCKKWKEVLQKSSILYRCKPFLSYEKTRNILKKFSVATRLYSLLEGNSMPLINNIGIHRKTFYHDPPYMVRYNQESLLLTYLPSGESREFNIHDIYFILKVSERYIIYVSGSHQGISVFDILSETEKIYDLPPHPIIHIIRDIIFFKYRGDLLYILIEGILVPQKYYPPVPLRKLSSF